tara:strand:+ start:980 stop:1699 length:720 start_codon:yes stop_codon:yes gene_type:complete
MILITRPIKESKILAHELSKYKIQTHIEPLLSFQIKNVNYQFIESKNYIVSSVQAVHSIKKNNLFVKPLTKETKFFVVGKKVVEALNSIGIHQIENKFLNSNDLVEFMRHNNNFTHPFIYLCGNNANQKLIQSFEEMRNPIEQIILYEAISLEQLKSKTIKLIGDHVISGVVLYSMVTAQTFLKLITRAECQKLAQDLAYYCLSENIASFMQSNNYNHSLYSDIPEQESLIQLITSSSS